MQKVIEYYLNCLESLHDNIKSTIEGLSQSEIDWVPGPEMNSLGIIVAHVAGSERFMIGDNIAKESSGRNRDSEFRTRGIEPAALIERLDNSLAYARQVLERLNIDDLDTLVFSPYDGGT